jgi:hypothetical protein
VSPSDGAAWREDMVTYRPFLSYSELGALIDGNPTELHDAMHNLLGLGPLTDSKNNLRLARKRLTDDAKAVVRRAHGAEGRSPAHRRPAGRTGRRTARVDEARPAGRRRARRRRLREPGRGRWR